MVIELGKVSKHSAAPRIHSASQNPARLLARALARIAAGRQAAEDGARGTCALMLSDGLGLMERLARAAGEDGTALGYELKALYSQAGEALLRAQFAPSDALFDEAEALLTPIHEALEALTPPEPPPVRRVTASVG